MTRTTYCVVFTNVNDVVRPFSCLIHSTIISFLNLLHYIIEILSLLPAYAVSDIKIDWLSLIDFCLDVLVNDHLSVCWTAALLILRLVSKALLSILISNVSLTFIEFSVTESAKSADIYAKADITSSSDFKLRIQLDRADSLLDDVRTCNCAWHVCI